MTEDKLPPEMERELGKIGEIIAQRHSLLSSEFLLIVMFIIVVAFNRWLQVPPEQLEWLGYATGGWTGLRQLIKVRQ